MNNLSAAQVNAEVDAALAEVGLTSTITGRIDAAISTRLAAVGYTAPDNAAIASIASALAARLVGTIAAGTHTAQSGDTYARLGAPAGATVSADIADLPTNAELATALSGIGGGSAPTASQIADAVWDEALSGHATAGSAGAAMSAASASGESRPTDPGLAGLSSMSAVRRSAGASSWTVVRSGTSFSSRLTKNAMTATMSPRKNTSPSASPSRAH
jgi:hypothetical protein